MTVLSMNSGMKIWFEIWTQNLLWNIRYCELWLCVSTNNDESNVWMLSYLFFFFLIFADFKSVLSFVVIGMKERWENSNFCCTKKKATSTIISCNPSVTRAALLHDLFLFYILLFIIRNLHYHTHTRLVFLELRSLLCFFLNLILSYHDFVYGKDK